MRRRSGEPQRGFTIIEFIVVLVLTAIMAALLYNYFGTSLTRSGDPANRLKNALSLQMVMENIVADFNRLNAINLRYHWLPSTYYRVGTIVTPKTIPSSPNGGHYYRCISAGTSGTTEPTWPITTGGTVSETGGPTWQESGNLIWQKNHAYAAGSLVLPINNNGHYYKCTVAGTSGGAEPTWPTAPNATVTEAGTGRPSWREAGTILESSDFTDNIKYYLTNTPGRYDNNSNSYTVVSAQTKFIQFSGTTEVDAGASGTSNEKNYLKVTIKSNASNETISQIFTIE